MPPAGTCMQKESGSHRLGRAIRREGRPSDVQGRETQGAKEEEGSRTRTWEAGSAETLLLGQWRSPWTEGHGVTEPSPRTAAVVHACVRVCVPRAALGQRRGCWCRWHGDRGGNCTSHSGGPRAPWAPLCSRPLQRAAWGRGPSWEDGAEAATWRWASLLGVGEAALWEPG